MTFAGDLGQVGQAPSDNDIVMKLVGGVAGLERMPELMENVGRYVLRYEPQKAKRGERWLRTTDDLDQALGFADHGALHEYYRQSIGTRPWDGKPDRPLTVFHIEVAKRGKFREEES